MNALQAEVLGYAGLDEEVFKLRYMLLVARPFLVGVNNKEHEWLALGVLTEVPVTIVAIALVKGFLLKGLGGLCDVSWASNQTQTVQPRASNYIGRLSRFMRYPATRIHQTPKYTHLFGSRRQTRMVHDL
jgi:hypothetical protein